MRYRMRVFAPFYIGLLFGATLVRAEIAIVVHPSFQQSLAHQEIVRIFLGKLKTLPNGQAVIPLNRKKGEPAREEFYEKVLNKSESQLRAYWSKLLFTGKGQPPREVATSAELIQALEQQPTAIGYLPAEEVTEAVKVLGHY